MRAWDGMQSISGTSTQAQQHQATRVPELAHLSSESCSAMLPHNSRVTV